ncbi:Ltp family lipoprotein [uncultured Catenibacterium sp.]|uniref:Ltp family lipoprotein n=1 Tax=uncultured Catenibacterium sp. TaxID=286142 RepID=UPI0025F5BF57|nr:Ltp family lipoprotein [uncultured Catenibacterium sp.]
MILFLLFVVLLVLGIVYFVKSKKNNEPNDKAKKTLLASLVFFVLFAIRCVSVDAFAMLGSIVFLVGIVYLVYSLFKKQPKKKALCMILAGFFIVGYAGCISDSKPTESSPKVSTVEKVKKVEKVEVADLSGTDAQAWCDQNGFKLSKEEDFSDSVAQGGFISQSPQAGTQLEKGSTVTVHYSKGKEPTMEDKNALAKAESYSSIMHMSKAAIYDQLTSSYGEGFPAESAQYAVDHLVADYKKNALEKAKDYQTNMHMSRSAIYDQLTSSYGEKFTAEEAQYAVDNLPQ